VEVLQDLTLPPYGGLVRPWHVTSFEFPVNNMDFGNYLKWDYDCTVLCVHSLWAWNWLTNVFSALADSDIRAK